MRRRYMIVSVAVPIAVGAIIAAYSARHADGTIRIPVPASLVNVVGTRAERMLARVTIRDSNQSPVTSDASLRTQDQARLRALELSSAFNTGCSHVVTVELMTLADAVNRTRRDPEHDFDLGAACYGETSRLTAAWRVELDDAAATGSPGLAVSRVPQTAILVLAAGVGTLIDLTLGYPVPQ